MATISDNIRGALFMIGAMVTFTVNDAFMKALGGDIGPFQALVLRGTLTTLWLAILVWHGGYWRQKIAGKDWRLIVARTACEAIAAWLFITSLFHMEIANLSAILQSLPLTVTLAGALFLGEAVGWRRLAAICIGFIGILMIIQPGSGNFNTYSYYAVALVGFVTARDLIARRISAELPSVLVALLTAFGVTVAAGFGALSENWATVEPRQWALLFAASLLIIGGYIFSVAAMRVGEISFVSPFRYSSLIVAMLLGAVMFGTFPEGWALVGAALVVTTGLYTFMRENKLRKSSQ
ncbi:MAG: DMT family transporter [Rhodobacteraceae bacterium]|nr:DMT family transporter [Paracoccaceae bacterium]